MELIFTEILDKAVPSEQQFIYTIARLKQIAEQVRVNAVSKLKVRSPEIKINNQ